MHLEIDEKDEPMNASIKTRITALVASILVTFSLVYLVAEYGYPAAAPMLMASLPR
jgi:hypothetical protein